MIKCKRPLKYYFSVGVQRGGRNRTLVSGMVSESDQ